MSTPLTAQVISSRYPWLRPLAARAQQGKAVTRLCPSIAGWVCLATAGAAWGADPQFADGARAALRQEQASLSPAYEVNSTVLPVTSDAAASSWPAWAADPSGTGSNSTQHIDITRWLTRESPEGRGRFGLSMGLSAFAPFSATGPLATTAGGPANLDLGVRWRSALDSGRHVDITAWARAPQWSQPRDAMGMIWQTEQPVFGARAEVQWASSKTRGLVPEFGAIGVQLQGGSRLVLRARKGGPMLYYRAKF